MDALVNYWDAKGGNRYSAERKTIFGLAKVGERVHGGIVERMRNREERDIGEKVIKKKFKVLNTMQEDNNLKIVECNRDANPGEIITFGTYTQTVDGADRTPIKWRVLQNSGSELFILSEYILDCKRYHSDNVDIKWRDCDLRNWLNNEFYNTAFNAVEKEFINITHCTDNGEGSPDTEDKVFLLSVTEIKDLFDIHGKDLRRAVGTDFAKTKKPDGCSLYVYDKTNKDNYIIRDGEEVGCSWWWLRTQGNKPSRACCSIRSYANVSLARDGVRSALKINLQ